MDHLGFLLSLKCSLACLSINNSARIYLLQIIGRGSGFVAVEIPFTPRAKRVLEMSLEEARQLGRSWSWRGNVGQAVW